MRSTQVLSDIIVCSGELSISAMSRPYISRPSGSVTNYFCIFCDCEVCQIFSWNENFPGVSVRVNDSNTQILCSLLPRLLWIQLLMCCEFSWVSRFWFKNCFVRGLAFLVNCSFVSNLTIAYSFRVIICFQYKLSFTLIHVFTETV